MLPQGPRNPQTTNPHTLKTLASGARFSFFESHFWNFIIFCSFSNDHIIFYNTHLFYVAFYNIQLHLHKVLRNKIIHVRIYCIFRRNRDGRAIGGERVSYSACSHSTGSRARSLRRKPTCVPSAKRSCLRDQRPPEEPPTRTFQAPQRLLVDHNSCCTRLHRRTACGLRAATCTTCTACKNGSTNKTHAHCVTGRLIRQKFAARFGLCRLILPRSDEPLAI